ncbi:MAG: hypothetical protein VKK62_02445 [Synechococcaceae cyanobacterium]|nr:hypothetical protein [Synechococcaceae cyanobacterium]
MAPEDRRPDRSPADGARPDPHSPSGLSSLAETLEAAEQRVEQLSRLSHVQAVRREHRAGLPETRGALGCLVLILAPAGLVMLWIQPAVGILLLCLALVGRLIGTAERDRLLRRRREADRLAAEQWAERSGGGEGPLP